MIPHSAALRQTPSWQTAMADAIRDPEELLRILHLDMSLLSPARAAARLFPLRVPRGFVARMRKGDPDDPLLRQVLPLSQERQPRPGYMADPVGDCDAMIAPGVLHKYHGRVLLTVTGACAVHCRYCFRRHFSYADANPAADDWRGAMTRMAADRSLSEVILSGGDPLMLSDRRLATFVKRLEQISHVRRLRLHTRLPVVLPERVTTELLRWLNGTRFKTVVVVHVNHANEIDPAVRDVLGQLRSAGVMLLNQSVLLRGVNDDVEALAGLSEALFDAGVLPYYLHALDPVQGAAHFEVSDETARALMKALRSRLPGYLLPRLVRETPGAPAKDMLIE